MKENDWFITTIDNPFCPLTEFEKWYAFDCQKGYNTLSFLARIVQRTEDEEEYGEEEAIDRGMEEMLANNISGLYKKAYRKTT